MFFAWARSWTILVRPTRTRSYAYLRKRYLSGLQENPSEDPVSRQTTRMLLRANVDNRAFFGVCSRTIRRHIAELLRCGLIVRVARGLAPFYARGLSTECPRKSPLALMYVGL